MYRNCWSPKLVSNVYNKSTEIYVVDVFDNYGENVLSFTYEHFFEKICRPIYYNFDYMFQFGIPMRYRTENPGTPKFSVWFRRTLMYNTYIPFF